MDFIALDPGSLDPGKNAFCFSKSALRAGSRLLTGKYGIHRQESHSFDRSAGFDTQRIAQRISEHLEAAADTENYFSGRSRLQYGRFQTILTHPEQILHRVFRSRKQNHIRIFQFGDRAYVAE